jgi:SAM-dependent methyltransferase
MVHRARLARVRKALVALDLPAEGLLIDFGCSDGYVIDHLSAISPFAGWRFMGYDRFGHFVRAARLRGTEGACFAVLDLNDPTAAPSECGDVVLCLETLEHVGRYDHALEVLRHAVRPGGYLVLTMPNETGFVGLAKFVARPIARRDPYRGFFGGRTDALRYAARLLRGGAIADFREPPRPGWGPHLGFDHRRVSAHIQSHLVEPACWTQTSAEWTRLHMGRVYVFRATTSDAAISDR